MLAPSFKQTDPETAHSYSSKHESDRCKSKDLQSERVHNHNWNEYGFGIAAEFTFTVIIGDYGVAVAKIMDKQVCLAAQVTTKNASLAISCVRELQLDKPERSINARQKNQHNGTFAVLGSGQGTMLPVTIASAQS